MKRLLIIFLLGLSFSVSSQTIIADHTIVDEYDDIPSNWIDSVKTKWLCYAGRSHSRAMGYGVEALTDLDATYNSVWTDFGTVQSPTTTRLRVDRATWGNYDNATGVQRWHSEASWWTNSTGIARNKSSIEYWIDNNNPVFAFGFAHSYELYASSASASPDPVTGNYWYGWSEGSSTGDGPYGLDDDDNTLTGNAVNMDDYLDATQELIDYCATNSLSTIVFFSTGPVERDGLTATDEAMYSGYLKNEHVRDYIDENGGYLFDFGDILSHNNAGVEETLTWSGNTFQTIHPDNMTGTVEAHLGEEGHLRLGKAMWWFLARLAGWEGVADDTDTDINSFVLSAQTGSATINTTNHTISIEVEYGTTVTSLSPTIEIPTGATISPTSGTSQDFSSSVTYTVTASDETTTQEWIVTVTIADAPTSISRGKPARSAKGSYINNGKIYIR